MTLLLLLCASTAALGQLSFEKETLEFTERAEAEQVKAVYSFRNETDAPITIEKVKTSCGCTTAELPKKTYAPGESGEIATVFKFGFRVGAQSKSIVVKYADAAFPDQKLMLKVMILEAVKIEPKLVFWRIGGEPRTRTMKVELEPGRGIRVKGVTSSNPEIIASVKATGKDAYEISVTPRKTKTRQYAQISLETESDDGEEPRNFVAYARVQ